MDLTDAFNMVGLKMQALRVASSSSATIKGSPTIGPDSGPQNSSPSPARSTPPAIDSPFAAFDDAQWDNEDTIDADTSMDLITYQSVANNIYVGHLERLRREIVAKDLAAREEKRKLERERSRLDIIRRVEEEQAEKSRILQQVFDDQVEKGVRAIEVSNAQFAAADKARLLAIKKRNEAKKTLLKQRAEIARDNAYLDEIQAHQKEIRQLSNNYQELLASLSAEHSAAVKAGYDRRFTDPIPTQRGVTAEDVQRWQMARQAIEEAYAAARQGAEGLKKMAEEAKRPPTPPSVAAQPPPPAPAPVQPVALTPAASEPIPAPTPGDMSRYISAQAKVIYDDLERFVVEYENSLRPLLDDPNQKKLLMQLKLNSRTICNTLKPESFDDAYRRLCSLISSQQHPLLLRYCTWSLAKILLDASVANEKPIYPQMAVYLAHQFPDLGRMLVFNIFTKVPGTVPLRIPRAAETEDTAFANQPIIRFYATLLISKPKRGEQHFLKGVRTAWQWLVDVLNGEPEETGTCVVLKSLLEVCGDAMQRAYGKQFQRLMAVLKSSLMPKLKVVQQRDMSFYGNLEVLVEQKRW